MFEGTCDRLVFEAYIEHVLIPELNPEQTIVMDNASFHKGGKINQLIESAGCKILYLPPYSPEFNPIEHYWASVKHHIRQNLITFDRDLFKTTEYVFQNILNYT